MLGGHLGLTARRKRKGKKASIKRKWTTIRSTIYSKQTKQNYNNKRGKKIKNKKKRKKERKKRKEKKKSETCK